MFSSNTTFSQLDRPVFGGPQDGPQLRLEHPRLGQRQADGAAAERRVGLHPVGGAGFGVEILVGAEVEGADGDRPPGHALDHLLVGLVLLALVRHVAAVEEQELGAEQADAFGPAVERHRHVAGQFDVGVELNRDAVDGFRLGRLEALELAALQLDLFLAQLVFVEDALVRVDDDDAAQAVDDQLLTVANQRAAVLQAEHRRDRHRAGQDGRVRGGAADVGDEGGEAVFLEGDGVGRREVVGDDDQRLFLRALGRLQLGAARPAEQFLDDALDDLHDVELALAQIGVVKLLELSDQMLHLLDQRPLGVASPFADDLARLLGQFRVLQEHRVDVDEGVELGRRVLGAFLHLHQFVLDRLDRRVETLDLLVHHARRQGQVRHLQRRVRHQHRPPDGNAAGNAQTVQGKAHRPTFRWAAPRMVDAPSGGSESSERGR
jgi:hypothetical protein